MNGSDDNSPFSLIRHTELRLHVEDLRMVCDALRARISQLENWIGGNPDSAVTMAYKTKYDACQNLLERFRQAIDRLDDLRIRR